MPFARFLLAMALLVAPAVAQQNPSDDEIYDKVRDRLATNRDVKGGGIEVEVKDGVVYLRGKVVERKQKTKAEQVAKKVKGVKKVVNELQTEIPAAK
ncbi:MAG TPA: BON domain-containing protein [Bryobacteraceae bacterium]|nr:BON domain-containing protein [Bryobacteraceae bacterium]